MANTVAIQVRRAIATNDWLGKTFLLPGTVKLVKIVPHETDPTLSVMTVEIHEHAPLPDEVLFYYRAEDNVLNVDPAIGALQCPRCGHRQSSFDRR